MNSCQTEFPEECVFLLEFTEEIGRRKGKAWDEHRGEEHVFSHTGLGAHPGGTVQLGALDQGFP